MEPVSLEGVSLTRAPSTSSVHGLFFVPSAFHRSPYSGSKRKSDRGICFGRSSECASKTVSGAARSMASVPAKPMVPPTRDVRHRSSRERLRSDNTAARVCVRPLFLHKHNNPFQLPISAGTVGTSTPYPRPATASSGSHGSRPLRGPLTLRCRIHFIFATPS
uniref:Uncharacterized protein n=1 Tax=Steinernema glaseri TaxID=37863 RepID=A0A1I7Y8A5_9BILA